MENFDNKLIAFPLSNMHTIGLFCLNKPPLKRVLFTAFFGSMMLFCLVTSFVQFFFIKDNIFDIVDNNEAVGGYGQVFIKLCICAYNKEKYLKLIKITKQFWKIDNCSDAMKKDLYAIVRAITAFQKLFFYATMGCSPIFTMGTFFGKKLPLGSWNMQNQEQLYQVVWFTYTISLPFVTFFVTTFDGIFLGMCYGIIIQFKILRNSLENLSVRKIITPEDFQVFYQELRKNIQYHKFLLEFLNEMQKVYSIPFLIQYLTIAPLICTEIYATSESANLPLTIRYGFAGFCLTIQLAFYCIASSLIFEEAMTISYGIYNSDWYSQYFRQLQTPMVMMMQASQKDAKFTACGLVPININTLASVIKVAFSASAVFKSLKE